MSREAEPPEHVQIRSIEPSYLPRMLEIYLEARASAGCYPGESLTLDAFQKLLEGEESILAMRGMKMLGFVSVWEPENFIHHLYICPEEQSRGIGSTLLDRCKERFGTPLSLKCDCCNKKAMDFYSRKGWVRTDSGVGAFGPWERLSLNEG